MNKASNNKSMLWSFVGLSIWTVSIGLAWNIAKTDSLVFGSNQANLSLAKQALDLKKEVNKSKDLTRKVGITANTNSDRLKASQIENSLDETNQSIDKVIEKTIDGSINSNED